MSAEPIAILGMGCRFPKASNLAGYRALLWAGASAVRALPDARWSALPDDPPELSRGGFVDDVAGFDAAFFGISALEARAMDPQHRMLLEVAWHAFEDAGLTPAALRGSRCAVIVGMGHSDYARLSLGDAQQVSAFSAAGCALSVGVNRVSQLFDLRGPSLALDTGCSSALSAFHAACASLAQGESDLALAGGVSALLAPDGARALAQAWLLSEQGHCKSFAADADGYVRSEGCGLVVLKRLRDALRDGDPITAVIRGSALGHDGRRESLTTPRAAQQAALMREALMRAELSARDIDYVEAHGVGSSASDGAELAALGEVFGHDQTRITPCLIGSVKTNLGHLEWASGAASLIKLVLALQAREIPAHLHCEAPSPALASAGRLQIVSAHMPWPGAASQRARPRRALVHAFGLAGTNCDLVLEQAPEPRAREAVAATAAIDAADSVLIALSAQSDAALRALAEAHAAALEALPPVQLADYAAASLASRAPLEQRLAVTGSTPGSVASALRDFAAGTPRSEVVRGRAQAQKVAFLFSGQGSQYPGMGAGLYHAIPALRRTLDQCDEILRRPLGRSLRDVIFPGDAERGLIDDTAYTQPALFAIEYALCELWRSRGVEPRALLGHSIGEYVAACVAGVMSLEDALLLVAERGRLLSSLPRDGAMAAVFCEADELGDLLAAQAGRVAIAAYNAPGNVVISGAKSGVEAILAELEERFVVSQPLRVSHAFHSPLLDPILAQFRSFAAGFRFRAPSLPLVSNVTGELLAPGRIQDANYWTEQLRGAVHFGAGVKALAAAGCDTFLEVGPGDTLIKLGAKSLSGGNARWLSSLRKGKPEQETWLASAATLFAHGAGLLPERTERRRSHVALPSYPFQRQQYWLEPGTQTAASTPIAAAPAAPTQTPSTQQRAELEASLRDALAQVLDPVRAAAFDTQLGLFAQGLDSLAGIALHERLERLVGRALPQTFLFDHPTLDAVSRALLDTGATPAAKTSAPVAEAHEPIAVIGMACRFPGADDPEQFWQLLREARDVVTEVPAERWSLDTFYAADPDQPGKTYARHGGYLTDIAGFDHELFGISRREASAMDPQQRLLLELCWEALERAGQPLDALDQSPTSVFMGAINNEYLQRVIKANDPALLDAFTGVGNLGSAIAGRISYHLGLRGPSLTLDSACSSSLVAVHLACRSLQSGESTLALAGGVNLLLSPDGNVFLSRAHALAADGRCKTFDAEADGYVRAEGAGVVVLKRLSAALADGDPICAVIRGSAMNHNGRASGFTVPSAAAQSELLQQALTDAGVAPAALDCLELHGTGTALGDPLEFSAIQAVFGAGRRGDRPLYLSSVKTNLGHLEAAAGIAGLIKLVLSLQHQQIPAHRNLSQINPRIALSAANAVVPQTLTPWNRGSAARCAGVSSFGMSGTNAHVLLEEAPQSASARVAMAPGLPFVLPLSARGEAALSALAQRWSSWLERAPELDLAALCHTAALRRTQLKTRAVATGGDRAELIASLQRIARGERPEAARSEPLRAALEGFVRGERGDFGRLFVGVTPCATLPTYPFQRVRCWLELEARAEAPSPALAAPEAAPSPPQDPGEWLYRLQFQPKPSAPRREGAIGRWLVLSEATEPALGLMLRLSAQGVPHVLAEPAAHFERISATHYRLRVDQPGDVRRLLAECEPFDQLVNLLALGAPELRSAADASDQMARVQLLTCDATRVLVRCLQERTEAPQLVLVTRGAQPSSAAPVAAPAQALSWGLGRSLLHELPELPLRLIDLDPRAPLGQLGARLLDELRNDDAEPQVALHGDGRLVARLARHVPTAGRTAPSTADSPPSYALESARPGFLADVRLRACERREPGAGEIEIEVEAVGLSFLDAMKATALLPGASGAQSLGLEVSGRVRALGAGVHDLRVGDGVIALCPEGARSFVCVPRALTIRRPAELPAERAAGLPLSFVLARYALVERARLSPGERVLIHSACGGVGWFALQIARALGAEIYASAGDAARRDQLRAAGIEHVFDSRLTDWPDEVLRASGGRGMDVILSSIAGEAGRADRAPLASEGRFIDIGLREASPCLELGGNRSLHRVDLRALLRDQSPVVPRLLGELARELEQGQIPAQPIRSYGIDALPSALRTLAQATGMGKVSVKLDRTPATITHADNEEAPRFVADACYVISGGLGGLGLLLARFLVEYGARKLLLLGRSAATREAAAQLDELRRRGCTLNHARVDVARADELQRALEAARSTLGPVRGVFHVAGVLDDALLAALDAPRFARVLSPKVLGALHLHALTLDDPLDHFVLFSSAASMLGNAGQTHYAAANAYLDALAAQRRQTGRPALSLDWGPWAEVGMAARAELSETLARRGVSAIEPAQGFALLARLLHGTAEQVGILPIRWSRFAPHLPARLQRSLLSQVSGASEDFAGGNASASAAQSPEALTRVLQHEVAAVLGLSAPHVDVERPLSELGLDSLGAVELKARASAHGVALSIPSLLAGASLASLVAPHSAPTRASSGNARPSNEPLVHWSSATEAELQLICFPYAGGGASVFRDWAPELPPTIALAGVQLPGRGARLSEAPHQRMESLLDELVPALAAQLTRPFAFFGHCMGALVMYEVTRRLIARGLRPLHLFASASPAPRGYAVPRLNPATRRYVNASELDDPTLRPVHQLDDTHLFEVLRFLNFAPTRALLDSPELAASVLPTVRADFAVCDTYRFTPEGAELDVPISIFAGVEDPFATEAEVSRWRSVTRAASDLHIRPGDHYFLVEERGFLARSIRDTLRPTQARPQRSGRASAVEAREQGPAARPTRAARRRT